MYTDVHPHPLSVSYFTTNKTRKERLLSEVSLGCSWEPALRAALRALGSLASCTNVSQQTPLKQTSKSTPEKPVFKIVATKTSPSVLDLAGEDKNKTLVPGANGEGEVDQGPCELRNEGKMSLDGEEQRPSLTFIPSHISIACGFCRQAQASAALSRALLQSACAS